MDTTCANCECDTLTEAELNDNGGLCSYCQDKVDEAEQAYMEKLESGYGRWLEQEGDRYYEGAFGQQERYEQFNADFPIDAELGEEIPF